MQATFPLGRIAGVRVGVHWSVLVIFAAITVGLARSRLPQVHPGHPQVVYWAIGLITAVLFFVSLLAHELAHAVIARRNGIEVQDIVLWLLGGVARLRGEASSPAAELRIAGVGPLVSFILGVFFGLDAWLLHSVSGPGPVTEALAWLAAINVLLALFNTIPAAPLDGGRLLRALLWWRTGNRLRATATAAAAGRGFGWVLVLIGLLLAVRGNTFDGLWLALIGWFLVTASTMEARQAHLRETLAGIPVRNAMSREPVTVSEQSTVAEFFDGPHYRYHRHSAFPVTDIAGAPVGLLTVRAAQHVPQAQRDSVGVGRIMLPISQVTVAGPGDSLSDLLLRLEPGPEHRVLVVDGSRLVGIVSASDISRMVTWLITTDPRRRDR